MTNIEKISEWIYNKSTLLFIIALLSYVVAVSGLYFAKFESNFRSFFPKDSELIQTFDSVLEQYEQGDSLVLYLKLRNSGAMTSDNFEAIRYADALVNTLPYVRYVRSVTSFQRPISSESSIDTQYIGDWTQQEGGLEGANQYIASQTQLRGRLVADDYSGAVVLAQLDLPEPLYQSTAEIIEAAEEAAQKIEHNNPNVEVYITGSAAFDNGLLTEFYHMLMVSFPVIVVLVSLVVAWVSASAWITVAGLTASGLTLAATAGVFGWLPVTLDQTAVISVILVMVLTVVDCIHIGSTYIVCVNQSMTKEAAIKESIRANLMPIFFTTLTTSVGLMTMFFTGSPPFVLFAKIALVGIITGYVYSFIFMTAISIWAPIPVKGRKLPTEPLVDFARRTVLKKPKQIIAVFSIITITALFSIPLNKIDEDTNNYFMPGNNVDNAIETIQSDFKADNQLSIALSSTDGNLVTSPAVFLAVDRLQHWLNSGSSIVSTFSINDVIREMKGVWDNKPESTLLPTTEDEYGQLLLVYEMSLVAGQSTAEFISTDRTRTLVTVFVTIQRIPPSNRVPSE